MTDQPKGNPAQFAATCLAFEESFKEAAAKARADGDEARADQALRIAARWNRLAAQAATAGMQQLEAAAR